MRKEVNLYRNKGYQRGTYDIVVTTVRGSYPLVSGVCGDAVKTWLGLDKQVQHGRSITGYLSVTFTPIKKGGKK